MLEDQTKTLNENLASGNYEATVEAAFLILQTHNNSADDIARAIEPIITILPPLAEKAPWLLPKLIPALLTYHYIETSPTNLARVTDAILPIVPLIKDEAKMGDDDATYIIGMMLSANKNSPENLTRMRNAAVSIMKAFATDPLLAAEIGRVFLEYSAYSPGDISPIRTALIDLIPALAKVNARSTAALIKDLSKNLIPSEYLHFRTTVLSAIPDLASKDGGTTVNIIAKLLPHIIDSRDNVLCPHFARAHQGGESFIWFIPTNNPEDILVLEGTRDSMSAHGTTSPHKNNLAHYQKITTEGQSLKAMFSGSVTPQETVEKISAETGTDYRALTL